VPRANATDVAMAIVVGTDANESRMKVVVKDGQQAEIKLAQEVRLVLVPTLQKGDTVLVAAQVYAWDGSDYKLAGEPRLLMRQGEATTVQLKLGDGHSFRMTVTPTAL